jgi:hypothetical protein
VGPGQSRGSADGQVLEVRWCNGCHQKEDVLGVELRATEGVPVDRVPLLTAALCGDRRQAPSTNTGREANHPLQPGAHRAELSSAQHDGPADSDSFEAVIQSRAAPGASREECDSGLGLARGPLQGFTTDQQRTQGSTPVMDGPAASPADGAETPYETLKGLLSQVNRRRTPHASGQLTPFPPGSFQRSPAAFGSLAGTRTAEGNGTSRLHWRDRPSPYSAGQRDRFSFEPASSRRDWPLLFGNSATPGLSSTGPSRSVALPVSSSNYAFKSAAVIAGSFQTRARPGLGARSGGAPFVLAGPTVPASHAHRL